MAKKKEVNSVALDKLEKFKKEFETAKKSMHEQASEAFKEVTKEIFSQYEWLESFGWNQYTPYFNDGDSCHFGVNLDSYSLNINGESNDDLSDEFYSENNLTKKDVDAAADQIVDYLAEIPDEVYEDMFGDHASITIHRDGRAEVDEYDHD